MKRRAVFAGGIGGVIVLIVACSSSSDNTGPAPNYEGSCATLASQCHPYGTKPGIGKDCHELGHAGDISKCGPRLAECQAACPETDAGEQLPFQIVDGAVVNQPTTDASDDAPVTTPPDAGPDACETYCTCLQATCKAKYDEFYAMASCVATCKTFSAENRTCWSKFCEKAKTLSEVNRNHECDHASGKLGDFECDTL